MATLGNLKEALGRVADLAQAHDEVLPKDCASRLTAVRDALRGDIESLGLEGGVIEFVETMPTNTELSMLASEQVLSLQQWLDENSAVLNLGQVTDAGEDGANMAN